MKKIILPGILSAICVCLVGCGFRVNINTGNSITEDAYTNSDQYTAGDFTYSAADVMTIEVSWRIGKVTLTLPANTGASVEYSSTSGDLKTELPYTVKGDLMVFGGGGYQICVGTVSGDLEITEEAR